jgi:hypothetical protein
MNRTIKEATVQRYHCENHDQLRTHLSDFVAAYNFAKRLKTLAGLTDYEFICQCWQKRTTLIYSRSHPSNAGTKHQQTEELLLVLRNFTNQFWSCAERNSALRGAEQYRSRIGIQFGSIPLAMSYSIELRMPEGRSLILAITPPATTVAPS